MSMPQSRIENASSLQKMRHKFFFSGGDKFYLVMIDVLLFTNAMRNGRRIVVGVTGFKLTISRCSLIR